MAKVVRLCAADLAPGHVRQIEIEDHDQPLALFHIGDAYYLTEDYCTHGFASLSQGDIEEDRVICPLHGGAFEITTGKAVELPCTVDLKMFRVWRDGEDVVTDLEPAIPTRA